jgi:hypothetical protein
MNKIRNFRIVKPPTIFVQLDQELLRLAMERAAADETDIATVTNAFLRDYVAKADQPAR